jgi:hypothetical protein
MVSGFMLSRATMRVRLLQATTGLFFVVGCGPRPGPTPTPVPEASLPIQARVERALGSMQMIEDFKVSTREKYDDPAAGVRVKFVTAEGLGADVFAYPVETVATDTSVDQRRAIAIAEAADAVSAIRAYEQSGAYQNVVVAQPTRFDITGPSGYVAPGAYVSVSLRSQGQPRRSDLYVINFRGTYIKIRATYTMAEADAGAQKDVAKLLTGVVAALDSGLGRPATIHIVPPRSP